MLAVCTLATEARAILADEATHPSSIPCTRNRLLEVLVSKSILATSTIGDANPETMMVSYIGQFDAAGMAITVPKEGGFTATVRCFLGAGSRNRN
jgi:hypothetical protein